MKILILHLTLINPKKLSHILKFVQVLFKYKANN